MENQKQLDITIAIKIAVRRSRTEKETLSCMRASARRTPAFANFMGDWTVQQSLTKDGDLA